MADQSEVQKALAEVDRDGCDGKNCNTSAHVLAAALRQAQKEAAEFERIVRWMEKKCSTHRDDVAIDLGVDELKQERDSLRRENEELKAKHKTLEYDFELAVRDWAAMHSTEKSRADALAAELAMLKLDLEMMALSGAREIPSAKALIERAEQAEAALAERTKDVEKWRGSFNAAVADGAEAVKEKEYWEFRYNQSWKMCDERVAAAERSLAEAREAIKKWNESEHETEYDGRAYYYRSCCNVSPDLPHKAGCPALKALASLPANPAAPPKEK